VGGGGGGVLQPPRSQQTDKVGLMLVTLVVSFSTQRMLYGLLAIWVNPEPNSGGSEGSEIPDFRAQLLRRVSPIV
jgi:hypothetical protein